MTKSYTAPIVELEDGDLAVQFEEEYLSELGWKEGDEIVWKDNGDGSYTLTKKIEEHELVLVETVSIFRIRYAVQVPKGKSDWALDTVTMEEALELSQEHVSENITSHRIISEEEYLRIFNEDNDYLRKISDEDKRNKFVTKIDQEGKVGGERKDHQIPW
jgi:hypothetical protein